MDRPHRPRLQIARRAQAEPRLQQRLMRQAYQHLLPIVTATNRRVEPATGRRRAAGDPP